MGTQNNTSPAHTPGPWHLINIGDDLVISRKADGDDKDMIADLIWRQDLETYANGQLIAEAPELLKLVDDLWQLVADTADDTEPSEEEIEIADRMNAIKDRIHGR